MATNKLVSEVSVDPESITLTRTSGNSTVISCTFARNGNVAQLSAVVRSNEIIPVGDDLIVGSINAQYAPKVGAKGAAYSGSAITILNVANDGSVNIRVAGASMGKNAQTTVGITYLI